MAVGLGLCGTWRQWREAGSGAHGTWMPTDDFMRGWRRTFFRAPKGPAVPAPLRLYMDYSRLMREVQDISTLRRGDHCVIAVKVSRVLSPSFDRFTSFASRYGFCVVYHHFVVLDDVAYLDEAGVPRTSAGGAVCILEYTNTVPEVLNTVAVKSEGSTLQVPLVVARFLLFDKGQCQSMALADYGDMPCIFLLLQRLDEGDRDKIVSRAHEMRHNHQRYNVFFNNCEHCVNSVCIGESTSPEVGVVLRNMLLLSLRLLALVGLVAGESWRQEGRGAVCSRPRLRSISTTLCHSIGLATAYIPAVLRYKQAIACLGAHRKLSLFEAWEERTLIAKERARVLLVGGGGVAAFVVASVISRSLPGAALALCVGAPTALDSTWTCATVLWAQSAR